MIYFDCVMNWVLGRLNFHQMILFMKAARLLKQIGSRKDAE